MTTIFLGPPYRFTFWKTTVLLFEQPEIVFTWLWLCTLWTATETKRFILRKWPSIDPIEAERERL